MMETDLRSFTINDFLRSPDDGNAGTVRRHDHEVPFWATFEIMNVAVVRQNLRPQFKVRGCFEDELLRGVHDNRIGFAHAIEPSRSSPSCANLINDVVGNERRMREVRRGITDGSDSLYL